MKWWRNNSIAWRNQHINKQIAVFTLGLLAVTTAWAQTAFYEIEVITEPTSEFLKLMRQPHYLCKLARQVKGLAPVPFPPTPQPYVLTREWTVSNGRDYYVLRKRDYNIAQTDDGSELNLSCRWAHSWNEQITISRGGRVTNISRYSDGPPEIERNAYAIPWELDNLRDYPLRRTISGVALRCITPEALASVDLLQPLAGVSESCIAERPAVFRDFSGESLKLHITLNANMLGSQYQVLTRFRNLRQVTPTAATWDPATYLRD